MKIDLEVVLKQVEAMWSWGEDQQLLRYAPNIEDLEPIHESVDILGMPYIQGGGRASYTYFVDTTAQDEWILVETRDFHYELYPIWENARIVPEDDRFYAPVKAILDLFYQEA